MPDGSNIYAGVAGYFGKPDHTGKTGVFQRAACLLYTSDAADE